ncbi:MAG: hypothetical protein V1926_01105 [Candidatus Peregrinibacteria bacterium]
MHQTCSTCRSHFEIADDDVAFYHHISPVFAGKKCQIPPPRQCPQCRLRHRLSFRNQTALFKRVAAANRDSVYSMYPQDAPFPVMHNEDWFGGTWDALHYGCECSLEQPFFEQMRQLHETVPRYAAVNNVRTENCEYCNNVSDVKNCYLTFTAYHTEDCMYGESILKSKDCIECTMVTACELCYDCINCTRCTRVQSSFNSENCADCFFLTHCRHCSHCFGCANLRHKQYCIWNEQKSREEYEAFLRHFRGTSFGERERYRQAFEDFQREHPRPHTIMHLSEDCTGNCIQESRNVKESYFIENGDNLKYCFNLAGEQANDCRDLSFFGRGVELVYESVGCGNNVSRLCFCYICRNQSSDLFYCISCDACRHCFGCVGLWRKEYCILNKQYTKETYEETVMKLIEHMRRTNEWGAFFPLAFNPTPYNRSVAYRYYPISEEEARRQGCTWFEEDVVDYPGAIAAAALPDALPKTEEPIVVKSAFSGRPFNITTREIQRYRTMHVPLPRTSYEERMNKRAEQLGRPELYQRTCMKTGKTLLSPYPPEAPYTIWDREEYEKEFQ